MKKKVTGEDFMKKTKRRQIKRIIDTKLWKTGNSYVVTIPRKIVDKMAIKEGHQLEIIVNISK